MMDDLQTFLSDHSYADREAIEQSLREITAQRNSALIEACVAYPVYVCVPASGNALLTVACPVDPSDGDWSKSLTSLAIFLGACLIKS